MDDELISNEEDQQFNDNIEYNQNNVEDYTQLDEQNLNNNKDKNRKRKIMDSEEEWTVVRRKEKKSNEDQMEVYISNKEPLPKQFALAKILNTKGITDITQIKYINAFKILLHFSKTSSVQKLLECKYLKEKGWTVSKPFEVTLSFGVIRDVELDLPEEEIKTLITSSVELVNVKRLKRMSSDNSGWIDSESVRLGFKGSTLPSYVYIYGVRVQVSPYVYPVTQCTRCWKFGHTLKTCPSRSVICPKCSKDHPNCETQTLCCANCRGRHMVLSKNCPIYLKERKIRNIMAEFNCSYRKALSMYVPSTNPPDRVINQQQQPTLQLNTPTPSRNPESAVSYASVTKNTPTTDKLPTHERSRPQPNHTYSNKTRRNNDQSEFNFWSSFDSETEIEVPTRYEHLPTEQKKKKRNSTFDRLYEKIKQIIFNRNDNLKNKIKNILQMIVEWIITWCMDNISDGVFLKNIFNG